MRSFDYDALPGRVVFGVGSISRLPVEVERLGVERALLIFGASTKPVADELAERLGERLAATISEVRPHVPLEAVEQARAVAARAGADGVVTIGGGSAIGLGKAIALDTGLPTIAVPTTYAGSEMTPIYGITSGGRKRTGRDLRVLPRTVIYDPALTTDLPASVTAPSGMNALAHCVEALYSAQANPITSLQAEEGIRALARGIPAAVREPGDLDGRSEALYGAYLAGAALGAVGMGIHHRICHVLGGTFGVPHGEANAVILPQAARFNAEAAPVAMDTVSRALGAGRAATAIYDFAVEIGAPTSLAALGFDRSDLDQAARLSVESPPPNPRTVDYEGVRALLEDAYHGRRPPVQ